MPHKILFIKLGSFSFINDSILKILQTEFQDHEVDVLDVKDIWKKNMSYFSYLINIYYFFNEYGLDMIRGHKKWSDLATWFFGTSYMSLKTDQCIRKLVGDTDYMFTFQTQTLFNAKLPGKPHFIYTDHTAKANLLYPDIYSSHYMRSARFIDNVESKIYQDADITFTCGSLITYSLLNQYNVPKEKALTVSAGSNATDSFIENNDKYASKNILFVGVDWERKGGPILIKAFEKVLQKHPDATLTIIGCNPANINLPNCNILGKLPPGEVAAYYNKAAVFCLPTLREPFGIVFVEAMHYKLPIIANNIGSIPDMVINDFNGFLIDNDVDGYADALCKLFDDPLRGKLLGENGFDHAQSEFTWELAGKKMKAEIVKYCLPRETANPQ